MKNYKDLSVRAKIPVMPGIAAIAVLTLVCVLLVVSMSKNTFSGMVLWSTSCCWLFTIRKKDFKKNMYTIILIF